MKLKSTVNLSFDQDILCFLMLGYRHQPVGDVLINVSSDLEEDEQKDIPVSLMEMFEESIKCNAVDPGELDADVHGAIQSFISALQSRIDKWTPVARDERVCTS